MHVCPGLALVIPSGQSLVADYYTAASRGSAFGALYLTGAVGGMLGSLFATNLGERCIEQAAGLPMKQRLPVLTLMWTLLWGDTAGEKHVAGIPGWRFVFFVVASLR